jgi:hypothetical protein
MPIWKLTPSNLPAPQWAANLYTSEAIVRALTEKAARHYAYDAFVTIGKIHRRVDVVFNPWASPAHVRCTLYPDSLYAAEGPDGVLALKGHLP